MKKFEELKKGDYIFLIDEKNNYEIKKLKIEFTRKHVYDNDINFGIKDKKNEICLPGGWSRYGLFCAEEKVATDFVEKVIKKKKLFATLKPGDAIYFTNKKEASYGKIVIEKVNDDRLVAKGDKENCNLYLNKHQLYSSNCCECYWRLTCTDWEKGNYAEMFFVNEEDAKSYLDKIKKRNEKKSIDNYVNKVSNQGKPISFNDNKGNQLHYGDKVAYVRRNGLHAHTDISFGVIIGESKTKIKILDEEELKVGKPNADWWRNEGPFLKSDGLHALEPQNVVFISSGDKKLIEFGK